MNKVNTTHRQDKLIKTIESYQELNNLSDTAFAKLIGVHYSLVSLVKSGKHNPGSKFFDGMGKIPELRMAVYEYFSADEKVEAVK